MIFSMLFLILLLALSAQIHSHPILFLRHLSFSPTSRSDKGGWLFNWTFGWGESTVSVVDRSPPLTFSARPATFGTELEDPLLGYVIPLSSFTTPCASANASNVLSDGDNLACETLCINGPHKPDPTETWIALVQRGQCQFVDKVREAQRLGANAVVVGGDNPETSGNPDTLVNMYSPGDSSDISIAATFIKYSDYMELSALIEVSNTSHSGLKTLSLLLTTDYSAWEWPVLTFALILLLPSSLTLTTLFIHRIRTARAAQRDRAPEDIVKNLPSRIWTGTGVEKQDGNSRSGSENAESVGQQNDVGDASTSQVQPWHVLQSECAICLSEFVKGDTVRILPCHHIFHLDEVDAWLIHRKKLCPICKADVTQPPQKFDSSESSAEVDAANITTPPIGDSQPMALSSERTPLLSRTSS